MRFYKPTARSSCFSIALLLLASSSRSTIRQCHSFQLSHQYPTKFSTQYTRHTRSQSPSQPPFGRRRTPGGETHVTPLVRPVSDTSTALSVALSSITAPLGSISVLAVVILVHESGHFLAARSMGIRVKQFSVGVGPKLAGFRRTVGLSDEEEGKDGEETEGIDFNLRAIPLGGYVEFPENYNATLQLKREEEADSVRATLKNMAKEDGMSLQDAAKQWKRGNGNAPSNGVSSPAWWPFGKTQPSTNIDQGTSPVVEEDGSVTTIPIQYYEDPDLLQNRPWGERAIVLSAGVVFNLILSFTCFFGLLTVGDGLEKPVFNQGALVGSVTDGAASVGILNKGDVILAINGRSVSSSISPSAFQSSEDISELISNIRKTPAGESLNLSVLKPNSGTPAGVQIKPQPFDPKNPTSPSSIGVTLGPNFSSVENIKAASLPAAARQSITEVKELSSEVARTTLKTIGSLLVSGSSSGRTLSGPLGVVKSGADVVSRDDYRAVVGFVAVLSINLAVINSLPFPALDGGQLLFVLAEAVAGRKIDQRVQEGVNGVALLFLLGLSVTATLGDLGLGK